MAAEQWHHKSGNSGDSSSSYERAAKSSSEQQGRKDECKDDRLVLAEVKRRQESGELRQKKEGCKDSEKRTCRPWSLEDFQRSLRVKDLSLRPKG
jgi:hypothetical protein